MNNDLGILTATIDPTVLLVAATVALAYFTWRMAEGVKTQSKLLHTQMGSDIHFENVRPLPDSTLELRLYNYGQSWATDVELQSTEVSRSGKPIEYKVTRHTETNRIAPKDRLGIEIKLSSDTQLSTYDIFRDLEIKITLHYKDKYVTTIQCFRLELGFEPNGSPVIVNESVNPLTK